MEGLGGTLRVLRLVRCDKVLCLFECCWVWDRDLDVAGNLLVYGVEAKPVAHQVFDLPPLSDVFRLWSMKLAAQRFHRTLALRTHPSRSAYRVLKGLSAGTADVWEAVLLVGACLWKAGVMLELRHALVPPHV